MKKVIAGLTLALSMSSYSFAENVQLAKQYNLDLNTAEKLASNAEQACQQINKHLAVVVLDRGGQPLIIKRHETVGPHNALAAQKKLLRHCRPKPRPQYLVKMPDKILNHKISRHFQNYCCLEVVFRCFIKMKWSVRLV